MSLKTFQTLYESIITAKNCPSPHEIKRVSNSKVFPFFVQYLYMRYVLFKWVNKTFASPRKIQYFDFVQNGGFTASLLLWIVPFCSSFYGTETFVFLFSVSRVSLFLESPHNSVCQTSNLKHLYVSVEDVELYSINDVRG